MSIGDIADGVVEEIGRTVRFGCGCLAVCGVLAAVAAIGALEWWGWL